MLEDAFTVINAWGLNYKTSMVWDKERKNYGYYVGIQHEFLLIATKGSCTPDYTDTLFDSVIRIKRSKVHSEKPEKFREIIDTLYKGNKIELFARSDHKNWETWGNQITKNTIASN